MSEALKSRAFAGLLTLGGGFLVYRAVSLIAAGHVARYVPWLAGLTWGELLLATATAGAAAVWAITGGAGAARLALRLTAALIVLHGLRVAVFVLARTGPWVDFDLQPRHRPLDPASWNWGQVWIAGGLAALALVVLLTVWLRTRR